MIIIANILYLDLTDLTDLGVLETSITQGIYRKSPSWVSIKDPADKRKILIQYDTLNDQYKQLVLAKYGDPHHYLTIETQKMQQTLLAVSQAELPQNIAPTLEDVAHFQTEHSVTDYEAQQLARACAWLSFYLNVKTKQQVQAVGFQSKEQLLECILNHVTAEGLKCLNIKNIRVLKRKIKNFKDEGKDSLVSKKKGNKNAGKLCEVSKALLRKIYREHNAFPITHVVFQYNLIALEKGLATISESTAKAYLNQPDVQMATLRQRYGKDYHRHNLELMMSRKKPSFPNAMWVMDGTPLELFYKDDSRKIKRVYGFMVVDCFSWKIIGYSLGQTETEKLVFQGIKDACIKTASLPHQLQFDNSSAIKSNDMMAWYEKVSLFITPAEVGNARAKIIEPLLGHFRNQILRYYDNHSGGNITAKSQDSRINQEWLKDHPEAMPTLQQVTQQIEAAVEAWNSRVMKLDGLSPNDKYAKPNPKPRVLEFMDTINLFWKFRVDRKGEKRELKYSPNGLSMTINKERHTYMVYDANGLPDTDFHLNHLGGKFQVKYDSEDLEMIYLYKNDKPVELAMLKREAPMAIVDYKEGDAAHIKGFVKRRRDMCKIIEERNDEDDAMLEELELVHAETYLKAPVPVNGKFKDTMNQAADVIKGGQGSIYRRPNGEQEGGLA